VFAVFRLQGRLGARRSFFGMSFAVLSPRVILWFVAAEQTQTSVPFEPNVEAALRGVPTTAGHR